MINLKVKRKQFAVHTEIRTEFNKHGDISKKFNYCLRNIKEALVKEISSAGTMHNKEFTERFFPQCFSDYFSGDSVKGFNQSQFMNCEPKEFKLFLAFAVAFWSGDTKLNNNGGKTLPPPKISEDASRSNMLSFVNETIKKTKKFFAENEYDASCLNSLLDNYLENSLVFKDYDELNLFEDNGPKISQVNLKTKKYLNSILADGFNYFKNKDPEETFARLLITVALGPFLLPLYDIDKGGFFVFFNETHLDPELALNVLWLTNADGTPITWLIENTTADSFANKDLSPETSYMLGLSLANLCLASDDTDEQKKGRIELEKLFFNDFEKNKEYAATSSAFACGLLRLAECYYSNKGFGSIVLTKTQKHNMTKLILGCYSECEPVKGSYYFAKFLTYLNDPGAFAALEKSALCGCEEAILDLTEIYLNGSETYGTEKDTEKALGILENGFGNNFIHSLKGRCRYLLGKIYSEKAKNETNPKNSETFRASAENNFRLAKACGYQEAVDIINKAKKEQKNKPQICDCIDFYITNGSDKANLGFVRSVGNAKEIKTDENDDWINEYKSEIANNSRAVLVAAFFSDDAEKNIGDCIRLINSLNRLNNSLCGEEIKAKKQEIRYRARLIEEMCSKLNRINPEDSAVITEKLETIRSAIVEGNIKLGLHGVFLNIEKEISDFLRSHGSDDVSLINRITKISELFTLPKLMKKLMESVRIYVKADPEFATSIIDTELNQLENNLYFRVKIVDYATESAHQLISEKPLFAPCIENKEAKTNLVIFGSNEVAEKIITETMACASMGREFAPSVTVIDREENIRAVKTEIENSCIALYDSDISYSISKPVFVSASPDDPSIPLLASDKAENYENKDLADALRWGNYFVVATDDDKFNITFAKKLRGWLLMTDDTFERMPAIAVLVKNRTTASAVNRFEVGSHSVGYSWFDDYSLFCFGEEEKVFSAYELINNPNEKRAEYIHCSYSFISETVSSEKKRSFFDNDLVHESLASFYNNYYNHDSSLCTALSLPYRMFAAGRTLEDTDDYSEKQGADLLALAASELTEDKNSIIAMAKAEHNRWVAFMISRGWRKATEKQFINYKRRGVPKQQCFICKLHPYLAEWDELDRVHGSLQSIALNALSKTKLSNPKEYNVDSVMHTADFLNKYELIKDSSEEE